ncbi:MAG: DUF819 family protein [Bacteroidota bacterium]
MPDWIFITFQIICYFGIPLLLLIGEKHIAIIRKLGPVVLCYGMGIALGNIPGWQQHAHIGEQVYQVAAILAIPLVLFSADLLSWAKLAKGTLLSFAFAALAACMSSFLAYYLIGHQLDYSGELTGMSVGVYTGGTQNLTAIGVGLGVPAELIAKANVADTIVSAVYLLLVLSVLPSFLSRILPSYTYQQSPDSTEVTQPIPFTFLHVFKGLGWAILCLLVSFGISRVLPLNPGPVIISSVTAFGLLCSLLPKVRNLPGTFSTGEYLLLVFCIAIGAQIRLDFITQDVVPLLVFFIVGAYVAVLIHFLLVYFAKIDSHTFLITSVAGIFNPIFIAPVARKLGNKEIIAPGMTAAIVGYAIGNFLGLAIAWGLA